MLTHEVPSLDITDITVVDPDNTYYMKMGSGAMTGYRQQFSNFFLKDLKKLSSIHNFN